MLIRSKAIIKVNIGTKKEKLIEKLVSVKSNTSGDNINNAQSNINNDESIKSFVKKFKGSIKKDSIKPLK